MGPLVFAPLYQTRVWGGRTLEKNLQRELPDEQPYGESWELSDRENEQSIVRNGPFSGKTLNELWTQHRDEIFGEGFLGDRFPLLIKILDAREDLSIQVHPPETVAATFGGEPKTEMWYIADCEPNSQLYLGLKKGASRESFEEAISQGTVAEQVHHVVPNPGDSIFIPSGRLHAIGSGFLIYEIQQNSDTTYRVFDWNRLGLDGKPRDLHLAESMASIDFTDFEPEMDEPSGDTLARCPYFQVDRLQLQKGDLIGAKDDRFVIVTVISGELTEGDEGTFSKGDFLLIPRNGEPLRASTEAEILQTSIPAT